VHAEIARRRGCSTGSSVEPLFGQRRRFLEAVVAGRLLPGMR
jgi:hypothetical protein